MAASARQRFNTTVNEAVRHFARRGVVSDIDLEIWVDRLTIAARGAMIAPAALARMMAKHLRNVHERIVARRQRHPPLVDDVLKAEGYTPEHFVRLSQIAPKMQRDLDAKILQSAELIKLNREEAINQTMRRFRGWASSVPEGGTAAGIGQPQADIRKPLQRLPYIERRVLIDQGHKLNANLESTIAENSGALAGAWQSNFRQKNYNYRPDHKERHDHIYTIRDNWALKQGLMKAGPDGYTDEITMPAEEVNCRCWYEYIYNLDSLPEAMLTEKGRRALKGLAA
jgi:hypothetical protein